MHSSRKVKCYFILKSGDKEHIASLKRLTSFPSGALPPLELVFLSGIPPLNTLCWSVRYPTPLVHLFECTQIKPDQSVNACSIWKASPCMPATAIIFVA